VTLDPQDVVLGLNGLDSVIRSYYAHHVRRRLKNFVFRKKLKCFLMQGAAIGELVKGFVGSEARAHTEIHRGSGSSTS
jgi:hypothetical protein